MIAGDGAHGGHRQSPVASKIAALNFFCRNGPRLSRSLSPWRRLQVDAIGDDRLQEEAAPGAHPATQSRLSRDDGALVRRETIDDPEQVAAGSFTFPKDEFIRVVYRTGRDPSLSMVLKAPSAERKDVE